MLPCPSPTSRACSNSCPSRRSCHPTISSSVVSFSSCLQSLPASGSFPMSQFFPSGSQSIGASASVLPMNIQDWFPLGLIGLISLLSKGLSRVSSNTTVQKRWLFGAQLYSPNSHNHMTSRKTIALTRWTIVSQVMSLLFNMLSWLVIAFLPRSKCLLISWLHSPSAVILKPQKTKSLTVSIVSPTICHEVLEPDAMILVFLMLRFFFISFLFYHFIATNPSPSTLVHTCCHVTPWTAACRLLCPWTFPGRMLSFKPTFSLSSFTSIKRLFSCSLLSAIRVVSSAYLRLLMFLLAILIPACAPSSPAFHISQIFWDQNPALLPMYSVCDTGQFT